VSAAVALAKNAERFRPSAGRGTLVRSMHSPARLLAMSLAAGSLLLGPGVATATGDARDQRGDDAPEASTSDEPAADRTADDAAASDAAAAPTGGAAASLDGLGARAKQAGATAQEKAKRTRAKASAATREDGSLSKRKDRPWVQRWAPERNVLEVGAFGGVFVPARDLELFEPRLSRPRQGFLPLATVAPEVGGRVGYYPLRYLGIEAEGAMIPTTTLDAGFPVNLWVARGHVVAQLPFASIAPFVVVGAGALGMTSHPLTLGNDVDPAFHLGIGTKVFINRRFALRLDLRDEISPRRGTSGGATNSIEALLGLSLTLGRQRDRARPTVEPEPVTTPRDTDGDGFVDDRDACPTQAGVAPDGCPAPADPDGDGFVGEADACPDEPGVAPDGCPDPDADRDGVLVPDDACPDEPETFNGFEDDDGCPDTVPDAVQQFSGRLDGVNFELGRATLTKASLPVLDEAVKVLQQYTSVRIEVIGHTDNTGPREVNMSLSLQRAEAVKTYLVDRGIEADRIVTRGAGPDEPIDSNASREGRASNRRIEFRVLD
jgi:outer membrane protein OmpA-like peptidoglycan-associated protein